ncbi:mitochondrial import inner membrane translocase subunit tim23 [Plakobranchus ocellatus]|uniref:Mitochondrial import inner membrane translocase subunit tim23 n=1 Tax=Plakobranchus ocellatus TaxID=259542 RepID=A0AAV3ZMG8_9GAST|nr:mitochondrial import inner membrane translocase subunit tim23 [Plakobranchus ocellatus]
MEDKTPVYNPYNPSDPFMNVPGPAGAIMSPYLNFDPAYLGTNADSQFIFPEGAARTCRWLELSFSLIGGSVFIGAGIGCLNGFHSGLKDVQARQLVGANIRTQ